VDLVKPVTPNLPTISKHNAKKQKSFSPGVCVYGMCRMVFVFFYLDDRCRCCRLSLLFLDLYLFVSHVVRMCRVIFSAVVIVALCGIKWQIIARCSLIAARSILWTTMDRFPPRNIVPISSPAY
jgi:hypothetical protein